MSWSSSASSSDDTDIDHYLSDTDSEEGLYQEITLLQPVHDKKLLDITTTNGTLIPSRVKKKGFPVITFNTRYPQMKKDKYVKILKKYLTSGRISKDHYDDAVKFMDDMDGRFHPALILTPTTLEYCKFYTGLIEDFDPGPNGEKATELWAILSTPSRLLRIGSTGENVLNPVIYIKYKYKKYKLEDRDLRLDIFVMNSNVNLNLKLLFQVEAIKYMRKQGKINSVYSLISLSYEFLKKISTNPQPGNKIYPVIYHSMGSAKSYDLSDEQLTEAGMTKNGIKLFRYIQRDVKTTHLDILNRFIEDIDEMDGQFLEAYKTTTSYLKVVYNYICKKKYTYSDKDMKVLRGIDIRLISLPIFTDGRYQNIDYKNYNLFYLPFEQVMLMLDKFCEDKPFTFDEDLLSERARNHNVIRKVKLSVIPRGSFRDKVLAVVSMEESDKNIAKLTEVKVSKFIDLADLKKGEINGAIKIWKFIFNITQYKRYTLTPQDKRNVKDVLSKHRKIAIEFENYIVFSEQITKFKNDNRIDHYPLGIKSFVDLLLNVEKYGDYKDNPESFKKIADVTKLLTFYNSIDFRYANFFEKFFRDKYNFDKNVGMTEVFTKAVKNKSDRFKNLLVNYHDSFFNGMSYTTLNHAKFNDFVRRWEIIPRANFITTSTLYNQRYVRDNTDNPKYMSDYKLMEYLGFYVLSYNHVRDSYDLHRRFLSGTEKSLFIPHPNKTRYFLRKSTNETIDGEKYYLGEEIGELIEDHLAVAIGNRNENFMFALDYLAKINEERLENFVDGKVALSVESIVEGTGNQTVRKKEYMLLDDAFSGEFSNYFAMSDNMLSMLNNMPWRLSENEYQQLRRDVFSVKDTLARIKEMKESGAKIAESRAKYGRLTPGQQQIVRRFYYEFFFLGQLIHGWNYKTVPVLYKTAYTDPNPKVRFNQLDQKVQKISQIIARWREFFGSSRGNFSSNNPDRDIVKNFLDGFFGGKIGRDGTTFTGEKMSETIFNIDCLHRLSPIFSGSGLLGIRYILNDKIMLDKDGFFTVNTKGRPSKDRIPVEEFRDYSLGEYFRNNDVISHYNRVLYPAFSLETAAGNENLAVEGRNLVAGPGGVLIPENQLAASSNFNSGNQVSSNSDTTDSGRSTRRLSSSDTEDSTTDTDFTLSP